MSLKRELLRRQKGLCWFCNTKVHFIKNATHLGFDKWNRGTIEHLLPQSRGDISTQWETNLVVSCARCNSMKSNMTLGEFKDKISAIYKRLNSI